MHCSICFSHFNVIILPKHICQFCFRAVCSKCSMQKMLQNTTNTLECICDACYSNSIKQTISSTYSGEKERLTNEITNIQTKYNLEKSLCEHEAKMIYEFQREIDEFKYNENLKEIRMENEYKVLCEEIEKIEKDFQELNSRLEVVMIDNWEADLKINVICEENMDFSEEKIEIRDKIRGLEDDIERLLTNSDENNMEGRRSQFHTQDLKVYRMNQEIESLNKEKTEYLARIKKMKESDEMKKSNIVMLMNKLAVACDVKSSEMPDLKDYHEQVQTIKDLERQVSRIHRKQALEAKVCKCQLF